MSDFAHNLDAERVPSLDAMTTVSNSNSRSMEKEETKQLMAKKRKTDRAEGLSRGMDIEDTTVTAQLFLGQSNNTYQRNLNRVENCQVKVESLLKEKKMV